MVRAISWPRFIESGADIDAADMTGATALMYAAQFDQDDVVDALIEAGANVNAADNVGWTPLIRAIIGGNIEAVRSLMGRRRRRERDRLLRPQRRARGRRPGTSTTIVAVLNGTEPRGLVDSPKSGPA